MEITELPVKVSNKFFRAFCPDPTAMYDLGSLYNEYNAKFFNGDLPELTRVVKKVKGVEIVSYSQLKWDGRLRSRTYGTYTSSARPGNGVIRLSRFVAEDPIKAKSTLLHEMLHKWLDLKGLDDGIKGHGEQFIKFARQINLTCQAEDIKVRVDFYNKEVVLETPEFQCGVIGETIYSVKDLDIVRTLEKVINSAFNGNHTTNY